MKARKNQLLKKLGEKKPHYQENRFSDFKGWGEMSPPSI
jgi:hypothetical protein